MERPFFFSPAGKLHKNECIQSVCLQERGLRVWWLAIHERDSGEGETLLNSYAPSMPIEVGVSDSVSWY